MKRLLLIFLALSAIPTTSKLLYEYSGTYTIHENGIVSYYGKFSIIPDTPPSEPDAYRKLEKMKNEYNSGKSLKDLKDAWSKRGVIVKNFTMKFTADISPGNREYIAEVWYNLENYVRKEDEKYVLFGSGRLESGIRQGYYLQTKRIYIFPKNVKILSVSPDYDFRTDNEIWYYELVDPRIEFTYERNENTGNFPTNYVGIMLVVFLVIIGAFFISRKMKK